MESIDITALFIITLVAIGTYSLRISGLLFSNKFVQEGKVKIFLEYLPATLLLSLVTPAILKEGITGIIAICFIALSIYKTKSILLSLVLGVAIVALSRNFL